MSHRPTDPWGPWSRRGLLGALASLAAVPLVGERSWARPTGGAGRRLVIVHAWGGWDPTFVFDPKDPADIDGPYVDQGPDEAGSAVEVLNGIPVLCDEDRRPAVTRFFEDHGDRALVVNGLQVGSVGHPDGVRRILTGHADADRPDLTAIVGGVDDGGAAAGFADLSGAGVPAHLGAHGLRVGPTGQLGMLLDDAAPPTPSFVPPPSARQAIADYLGARTDAARLAAERPGDEAILGDRLVGLERAARLRDLGLDLPTRTGLVGDLQRTLALLEQGACRAVLVDSQQPWDSHTGQERQHENFDALFSGLHELMVGLDEAGIDDVTVAVVSEMGRSPRRNIDGGTEHWPVTSALLLRSGVNGGRVLGATDDGLRAKGIDLERGEVTDGAPLSYAQFCAGLLEVVGVDPAPWLPGVTPFRAPYQG